MLQLEQERIFRRSWQYVGHDGRRARARLVRCDRAVGGRSGRPRARRGGRAARVPERLPTSGSMCARPGSARRSSARTTRGRTASTAGSSAAPRAEREGGIDEEELGLVRSASRPGGRSSSSTRTPTRSRSTSTLDEHPRARRRRGSRPRRARFLQRAESELDGNWKISAENFLECYHCPIAHPGSRRSMDVSPDAYLLEINAGTHDADGPPAASRAASYDPTGEVERGQFHLLFPAP